MLPELPKITPHKIHANFVGPRPLEAAEGVPQIAEALQATATSLSRSTKGSIHCDNGALLEKPFQKIHELRGASVEVICLHALLCPMGREGALF